MGFPISWLIDRGSRRNIVAASIVGWSVMTMCTGLSRNYWQLLVSRIGIGIGEAGGTPGANSLISDYFPVARRPMASDRLLARCAHRCLLRLRHHRRDRRSARLAGAVPVARGAGPAGRRADLLYGARAAAWQSRRAHCRPHALVHGRDALPVVAALGRARDGGQRADGAVGLGTDVLDADVPQSESTDFRLARPGTITGKIHLLGGGAATMFTGWLLTRPSMHDPRRIVRLMGWWIGAASAGVASSSTPRIRLR